MKAKNILLNLLFSISLLLMVVACGSVPKQETKEDSVLVQPKPLSDPQLDSLKNYLDEKRKSR
jgi:hypothetical protein